VVNPQIRDEVPNEHIRRPKRLGHPNERRDGKSNTDIAQDNEFRVLGLIERTSRVEMVDTSRIPILLPLPASLLLVLMMIMTRNISKEVQPPPRQLLSHKVQKGSNRSLLSQLIKLMHKLRNAVGVHLARFRDENHVLLHVPGGLVVLPVRDLPGEIGDQEGGVAEPAYGIVDDLRGRESLVSAFVSQDPESGAEETLDRSVHRPERGAGRGGWYVLGRDEGVEEVECRGETGDVAGDIVQSQSGVALKALLGDGADDISHRVVGELELIAVGVDELCVRSLGSDIVVNRRHGG
jgi:hypothetical protein